jgi:hypothetical protein
MGLYEQMNGSKTNSSTAQRQHKSPQIRWQEDTRTKSKRRRDKEVIMSFVVSMFSLSRSRAAANR